MPSSPSISLCQAVKQHTSRSASSELLVRYYRIPSARALSGTGSHSAAKPDQWFLFSKQFTQFLLKPMPDHPPAASPGHSDTPRANIFAPFVFESPSPFSSGYTSGVLRRLCSLFFASLASKLVGRSDPVHDARPQVGLRSHRLRTLVRQLFLGQTEQSCLRGIYKKEQVLSLWTDGDRHRHKEPCVGALHGGHPGLAITRDDNRDYGRNLSKGCAGMTCLQTCTPCQML